MRLSDLRKKTRKVVLEVAGERAEVEYRTHAVTVGFLAELKDLNGIDSVARQVEQVVARWELLDEDGTEIPATREAIAEKGIPIEFLTAVLNAITGDIGQGAEEKNG